MKKINEVEKNKIYYVLNATFADVGNLVPVEILRRVDLNPGQTEIIYLQNNNVQKGQDLLGTTLFFEDERAYLVAMQELLQQRIETLVLQVAIIDKFEKEPQSNIMIDTMAIEKAEAS